MRLSIAALMAGACLGALPVFAGEPTDRIIVKLRGAETFAKSARPDAARVARIADSVREDLRPVRTMFNGAYVLRLPEARSLADVAALARAIAGSDDVEFAHPDYIVHPRFMPNDILLSGQTYLADDPVSISAFSAWEITRGSAAVVVAVIDTGVRPHDELAGRLLPGYDVISDPARAGDGGGRDGDASDPGDFVTQAELDGPLAGRGCSLKARSSWHGTGVSGVIAANTHNGLGMAGIDWNAKILPVRALGKCGGLVSDIADGIVWASGGSVPGLPVNPNPAQVINLSLGGNHPCTQTETSALAAALAGGATRAVVAAAGNDASDAAAHSPSNCPGVISVASTTNRGRLAEYSNRGASVTLSAPGGDFNAVAGDYRIVTLSNSGTTVPLADSYLGVGGTSLAAPMISGVVSLMLAVNPRLGSTEITAILRQTAKPFTDPSCNTSICGAGVVNAEAAVKAARSASSGDDTPPAGSVTVVEFYNPSLRHYFVTANPDEIRKLDDGTFRGWTRTGQRFYVRPAGSATSGTSPVCRFYGKPEAGLDSHFYSPFGSECDAVRERFAASWQFESPDVFRVQTPDAGGACPTGTEKVYRLFNNRTDANHRYTTQSAIRTQMLGEGFVSEGLGSDGVIMCAIKG